MYNQITECEIIVSRAIGILSNMELPNNASIIFDIDDTLITNDGKCIAPVVMLYNFSKMLGIIPVIITARPNNVLTNIYTMKQLSDCGITGYNSLYLRPEGQDDVYEYKLSARKNVKERGMETVMSVGDMLWDIGLYGGVGVIIPFTGRS
jgi:hypothetical protein